MNIEKVISTVLLLALLVVMISSMPLMQWYEDRDESRDENELARLRTGLLVKFPDYSGNPNLSKTGATYKLEDGSCYHSIGYKDGLYIGKLGSKKYVLGDNLSGTITNGYHDIYVNYKDDGDVYGVSFGEYPELIGCVDGRESEKEEIERKEKEEEAKRKSREIVIKRESGEYSKS